MYVLLASLPSCGGAGTHVYCAPLLVACPSDTVIARVRHYQAQQPRPAFPETVSERGDDTFYLTNSQQQYVLRLEVPRHIPTSAQLHLAGVLAKATPWQGFTQLDPAQQRAVQQWFTSTVQPHLMQH